MNSPLVEALERIWNGLKAKAKFARTCCDDPDDRMYHAEDKTWWKRVGNHWVAADAPPVKENLDGDGLMAEALRRHEAEGHICSPPSFGN